MKFGKVEAVGRLQTQKKKAHKNAAPLTPLLGLVLVCIMNHNEFSVVGKDVMFESSTNI